MSDFDYWPRASMDRLVDAVRERETPPPVSDKAFWTDLAKRCREVDTEDEVTMDAEDLARDVIHELEQAKFVWPSGESSGVAVGDLGSSESRLASAVVGIKGVVFLASHPMEPLWVSDGIAYHTVVISPAIEPSKTLSSQLSAACQFLRTHRPALVCSSCSRLPALVIAAYEHSASRGQKPIRSTLDAALEALELPATDISSSDLAELDLWAETASLGGVNPIKIPMPPPPPPAPSTPRLSATLSCDSTATQIETELLGLGSPVPETPTKMAITRNGLWKRGRAAEEGGVERLDKSPRRAKNASSEMLQRGDCLTCGQENVLGWARCADGVSRLSLFECCACHDSNDEDDC